MNLKDVKVGMLVKSKDYPEISDKPGVVTGFVGDTNHDYVINIDVVDDAGIVHCCYAAQLEPAHDGCKDCKHILTTGGEEPCRYCRCIKHHSHPLYSKLPDLWEPFWGPFGEESKMDDTVQISKNDALLASDQLLRYANVIYACSENVDIEWLRDLAKRIRNGGKTNG